MKMSNGSTTSAKCLARVMASFLLIMPLVVSADEPVTSLKILMIGNSFDRLRSHLPAIVASVPGCSLELESATIGGGSFQTHCEEYRKSEADPTHMPYVTFGSYGTNRQSKANLQMLLKATQWDIVTIHQSSGLSCLPESYLPAADELAGYIKKHCPGAEIVIHQTWSYRSDNFPRQLRMNKESPFRRFETQDAMYDELTECYVGLAQHLNNARIIPVGSAIQIFRKKTPVKFKKLSAEELAACKYPNVPSFEGDVAGYFEWTKNDKGEMYLRTDPAHLNKDGKFLQSCVWFAKLYKRNVSEIRYEPADISKEMAQFLKNIAQEAVDTPLPTKAAKL